MPEAVPHFRILLTRGWLGNLRWRLPQWADGEKCLINPIKTTARSSFQTGYSSLLPLYKGLLYTRVRKDILYFHFFVASQCKTWFLCLRSFKYRASFSCEESTLQEVQDSQGDFVYLIQHSILLIDFFWIF